MENCNTSKKVAARRRLALFMFGFLGAAAAASEVSVFQHTLEYEPPEPYEAVIHYSGELTEGDRELIDKLDVVRKGICGHCAHKK